MLLARQLEFGDAFGDRESIKAREALEGQQRVVGRGQSLVDAFDEAAPTAVGDRVALADRRRVPLVADEPGGDLGVVAECDAESRASDLGPRVRLVPVHPAAAVLDRDAVPRGRPGAAAEPIACLEQQDRPASQCGLAGRRHPGEPAPDNDHVNGRRLPRGVRGHATARRPQPVALAAGPRASSSVGTVVRSAIGRP